MMLVSYDVCGWFCDKTAKDHHFIKKSVIQTRASSKGSDARQSAKHNG